MNIGTDTIVICARLFLRSGPPTLPSTQSEREFSAYGLGDSWGSDWFGDRGLGDIGSMVTCFGHTRW